MKFLDQVRKFFSEAAGGKQDRRYSADFQRMTDEEKEYEREKLHSLINSHPIPAKRLDAIERDISAD